MTATGLRGMTWNHRRAMAPLLETQTLLAATHPNIKIAWSTRPLQGFEFTPVADLAKSYDLIILDHPFCGDIAASGCLLPIDPILDDEMRAGFVGPSLETYVYAGKTWALPVDAACQVAVSRPDLMAAFDAAPPRNWEELLTLGRRVSQRGKRLAIGLHGVHSLMTFFTLCANLGKPCATTPEEPFVDVATAQQALVAMRALLAFCPREALDWNSIELHDAMAARDDLIFCPAVYCFATYAEADHPRRLQFHDFPGPRGPAGSTIGGTGLGISAHCAHPEAAFTYARFAASVATQRAFAEHHGQPARIEAWRDPGLDARFNGCYGATLKTIEQAWIRPRFAGYLAFQAEAGDLIEQHLRGQGNEAALLGRLQDLFARSAA